MELHDDKDLNHKYMCVFLPTLSSLYFSLLSTDKKQESIIEFHEEAPPFRRRPLSIELQA